MRSPSVLVFITLLFAVCLGGVFAQDPLDPYRVNVTRPSSGQNFVAGEKLPIVYRISANSTSYTLQLSISLNDPANPANDVVITSNADISKGFSQQVKLSDGTLVYEHQVNYDIPSTKTPGNYNVVLTNTLTGINTTIPIIIAQPLTTRTTGTGSPTGVSGGGKSMWDDSAALTMTPAWISSLVLATLAGVAMVL